MSDFVHLHVHSHYSLMDGLNTPHELLEAAKNQGQTSLSITDHGTLSSHRDMQIAAKELGMKPILGLEAYISATDRFDKRAVAKRDDNTSLYNHIILLAKNDEGLKNLQKLSQIAWTEGYYHKPRIDMECLFEHGDGIIVISGCMNGLISKAIERGEMDKAKELVLGFKKRFGEDFYIEVQAHNPESLNTALFALADEFGVKPVATGDCHFAKKEERDLEELLLILSTKPSENKEADYASGRARSSILDRFDHLYPNRPISFADINVYIQSRSEIEADFVKAGFERKDIYESSIEIDSKIEAYDFHENLDLLPVPKKNALKTLKDMCDKSLVDMGLDNEIYKERLEEELKVIKDKNFSSYFLVVSDMVNWAKQNEILVGPGRGSAAGSLVCYLMGITDVDPIKFDLLFFRFINPERNDFPDIDTDFMDRRRGEVKDYLKKKFKHVASISTYTYFKDKGVIRDVARAFLVPLGEVNKALKGVETFEEYESAQSTEEFRKKYPEVTKYASMLRGKIRGNGMHAAGVVVAKDDISKYVPIETRKDPNESVSGRIPVVAYDMEQTADLGLIKLDVLGLKTLSVIDDALKTIEHIKKKKIDLKSITLDDPKVFEMLSSGFTKGVFQAEATPYTNLLMKMGVSNFEDLAASNALVRPGAMNTVGGAYIRRKKGDEMVTYAHPIMHEFTERTYGVIIYQEQVMQACVYLGGMSWADADKVRKIIGKKKDAKEFDVYKDQFIAGASNHITQEDAAKLWHDFEAHAGYSFNRSHAIAYSMLSYYTAWLKCYYPLEFMFAVLKNEKDKDARTDYLLEAKRLGIKVLLPHINESELDFSIQGNSIRFGLSNIKYISDNIGSKITSLRPFKSYKDFTEKSSEKGSGINSRAIESLNMIGGAAFPDNPRKGTENENLYEYLGVPKFDTGKLSPAIKAQVNPLEEFLEEGCFVLLAMVKSIKKGPTWSRIELVDDTGSVGIFHEVNTQIEPGMMYFFLVGDNRIHKYVTINDVVDNIDEPFVQWLYREKLKIASGKRLVLDFTHYKTKANKMMAHIILSDADKNLERVIAFPKFYTKALGKMKPGTVCDPAIAEMEDGTLYVKEIS
ncbi:DNA polymerase III subunit alpha [uncultured Caudovirales phage]|uniref:DNA-directed DNA polymerase n=1 Tax=uncultured Caudovirales phage TaxID=2100421 RepID=A0A6J7WNF0_9CAUD|nr:DNA polymerase III subunit alpha [uncultured Caudovirales phage]